jgi:hypothetical protein
MLNCKSPLLRGFVRISRTDDRQSWNRAQGGEMLNWLMSWTILPKSDAVVRKHVDCFEMTQCAQAYADTAGSRTS